MREDNDVYVYNYRRHPDLDNPGVWHDHAFAENQPWYRHYYPQSFEMQPPPRPGRSLARSTLYDSCPHELLVVDRKVRNAEFQTVTGLDFNRKLYRDPELMPMNLRLAPGMNLMHRDFPNYHETLKLTSQRLRYDPNLVYNSTMKSEYRPHYPINDLDYWGGPKAQAGPPRFVTTRTWTLTKPTFPMNELFSVWRKHHPNISITKFDYGDPRDRQQHYVRCVPDC